MKVGSLFSGCGGLDLGFELAGFETKWFAETDKWCDRILNKNFPGIPNLGDVNELRPEPTDILIGGFPCQPVSQAGKKLAQEDERWLWPGFYRTIRNLQPRIVVVENVPGLRRRGLDRVLGDLAEGGYNTRWISLRSSDIGAPHRRERVFIIADSSSFRTGRDSGETSGEQEQSGWFEEDYPYTLESDNEDAAIPFTNSDEERLYRELERRKGRGSELTVSAIADADRRRCGERNEEIRELQFSSEVSISPTDTTSEGSQGRQSEKGSNLPSGCLTTDSYSRRLKGEWEQNSKWKDKPGDDSDRFASEGQEWGDYEQAIRRWEIIFEPVPPPLTNAQRLSPKFVEWMMGLPQDWTEGVSKTQRIKMLGNSVQVQCAYEVAKIVKALADFS